MSEVFDYVSDFGRAAEWRVEVVDSSMSPPAPMRLGTRLREVSRIAGREVVTESVVDELVRADPLELRAREWAAAGARRLHGSSPGPTGVG